MPVLLMVCLLGRCPPNVMSHCAPPSRQAGPLVRVSSLSFPPGREQPGMGVSETSDQNTSQDTLQSLVTLPQFTMALPRAMDSAWNLKKGQREGNEIGEEA